MQPMDPSIPPDLGSLMDIQIPDSVAWWPPAPGWWLLLLLLLGLLLPALRRLYLRLALRRAALEELERIRTRSQAGSSPHRIAMALSILLRRVALARMAAQHPGGLTGEGWLEFLDRHSGGTAFTNGIGRVLVSAPYAPHADFDSGSLLRLVEQWIRENT